jgi:uncharacterized Zn-binding protein involved in type VI secretion
MPDFLAHVGMTAFCPHGSAINVSSTNQRVKVMGQPVACLGDTFMVSGCPFQVPVGVGTKPQPCLTVQWPVPATRVKVMGRPVILKSSTGLCLSPEQIPQGPPSVQVTQVRVRGI